MKLSFGGMGQWSATLACGAVSEGTVVKLTGSETVATCGAGEVFCGAVLTAGRDGAACAVQLGGTVTVPYSDAAPAAGWVKLAGDGTGGVKALESGREYLVLSVNTTAKTVTFVL